MKKALFILALALLSPLFGSPAAQAASMPDAEVIVFHAGSLSGPYQKAAAAFEALHPEIKIILEASGSREAARKVTEQRRPCDIVASADYATIDTLLNPEFAKFNILFARNRVVLAYTNNSRYADRITADNWFNVLIQPDVEYGHTDPNLDPGGYRAVLTMQLAEKYYNLPGLSQRLEDQFHSANILNDGASINEKLRSGELDYFFVYESSARQAAYRYITLPEQIDFSAMQYADYYRQASLTLSGKTPGSLIEVKGEPIVYGLTLLDAAPHRTAALQFLRFLLTYGQTFLSNAGFIPMMTPQVRRSEWNALPPEIRPFVTPL